MKRFQLIALATYWLGISIVSGCTSAERVAGRTTASGTIDADTVAVSTQFGGRVVEILVDEGDAVSKGAVVLRLDAALLDAQLAEAEAAILAAEAQLEQVKAGPRPEELQVAKAELARTVAQRDGARRAWENAQAMLEEPQELRDRIDQARTQISIASVGIEQAEAKLHAAMVQRDGYPNPSAEYVIAQGQVGAAEAALEQARAVHAGALRALEHLLDMQAHPIELAAAVHAAGAAHDQAVAAVAAAQAGLEWLEAGPAPAEVAAAEANLKQAQAALEVLRVHRSKMTLSAPVEGLVLSRSIEQGEIAAPGATLLRLAGLDRVKLTVFIPQTQVAAVQLGQPVDVAVDAYPGRTFRGTVTFIAQDAEFTPRNVQTQEQRTHLVFAVTVSLNNPEQMLKPGMPADVTIITD